MDTNKFFGKKCYPENEKKDSYTQNKIIAIKFFFSNIMNITHNFWAETEFPEKKMNSLEKIIQ